MLIIQRISSFVEDIEVHKFLFDTTVFNTYNNTYKIRTLIRI